MIVKDVTAPSIECPLENVEVDADGNCDAFVTLPVPADGQVELRGEDCVLVAVTRERQRPASAGPELRHGRGSWHGVSSAVVAGLHDLADRRAVAVAEGETRTLYATLEFSGCRVQTACMSVHL